MRLAASVEWVRFMIFRITPLLSSDMCSARYSISAKFDSLSIASNSQSTVSATSWRLSCFSSDCGLSLIIRRMTWVTSFSNCSLFKNPGGLGSIMRSPSTISPLYHPEGVLSPFCGQGLLCGVLLRLLLASPLARSQPFGTDECAYEEGLVVIGAALVHDLIRRRNALLFLRYLLQLALGILPKLVCNDVVGFVKKLVGDEFLRRLVARIEIQGADECLESVGENYHPRTTRILGFSPRE